MPRHTLLTRLAYDLRALILEADDRDAMLRHRERPDVRLGSNRRRIEFVGAVVGLEGLEGVVLSRPTLLIEEFVVVHLCMHARGDEADLLRLIVGRGPADAHERSV